MGYSHSSFFVIIEEQSTPKRGCLFEPIVIADLLISSFDLGFDNLSNEQLTFTIEQSGLEQSYQVYTSESLLTNEWDPLGPVHQGTGGLLEIDLLFDYTDPAHAKQFFRVGVWVEQ